MSSPGRTANRLIHETSPYLLQHAYNPVNWFAWGQEAFDVARRENKPIFLSVGYSACHWCHVMEHESFENDEIAALLNTHYVSIKVDREERPDLDQIYMKCVQLITQRGGWPMSVFLDHEGNPFYGGTYWPRTRQQGMPGFDEILTKISDIWKNQPEDVRKSGTELTEEINRLSSPAWQPSELGKVALENAGALLLKTADRRHGGFGMAPKFPHAMDLRLLMRVARRFKTPEAVEVVTLTLDKMSCGGIYDHLGGGFARYSTDAYWLVPHFEKMLYDNALLTNAYLEGFQLTGEERYAEVAREICDYVLRDMTSPEGAFYATEDADSEGVEGKFFTWTEAEIDEVLGEESRVFKHCYDVTSDGNWEEVTILNVPRALAVCAEELELTVEELTSRLASCRASLFDVREQRVHPGKDTKILLSWNGLMLAALAQAANVLHEPRYALAASNAAKVLCETMIEEDDRVYHSFKDGQAKFNGYLDDYACFIDGLVETYQATGQVELVETAMRLADRMLDQFADEENGTFYYTSKDHETLIARQQDFHDEATPSGYGMAVTALAKLGRIVDESRYEEAARRALTAAGHLIKTSPYAVSQMLIAADFLLGPTWECVLVGGEEASETVEAEKKLHRGFVPNKLIFRQDVDREVKDMPAWLHRHFADRIARDGEPTLYLCERGRCLEPMVGLTQIEAGVSGL